MIALKVFFLAFLAIGVNSRFVNRHPVHYLMDSSNILEDDMEDVMLEQPSEFVHPELVKHVRVARQLHGTANSNPDGSVNLMGKLPLAGNDKNVLSAIAAGNGLKNGGGYSAATGGLQLENVNGHSLSLTKTHIPAFGDQLTAAGKLNLVNTPDHRLNANAFTTRNMPNIPHIPNFTTNGGSVDYTFKNKIGGSLGVAHTDLFQKTDLSAMGNLNLFRDRASSLDFSGGASRSFSPFIPKSSWQPTFGLSYTRNW